MSVIGEKVTDYAGKVTSTTITEAGAVVNVEAEVGPFGTVLYTATLGPAVDAAGEKGPFATRTQAFLPDGRTMSFSVAGTWRKSGHHKWELKGIGLAADGQRNFVVEELELATRSTKGTIYALDDGEGRKERVIRAIGEKMADYTGKVTSATMTAAGSVINAEGTSGSYFGTFGYTATFGPAVDAAGETGPLTGRVQDFRADGSVVPQIVTGVWRKSGTHQWEVKAINVGADGGRFFFVEVWDLATRSVTGTIYALD